MTLRAAPTGKTRIAAVIGDPVRHSLSPALHNAAMEALGLDWVYVALPVATGDVANALAGMRAFGIEGLSVTMPHKTDVARLADEASDDVVALDAANTVVRRGDRLRAEVTDGEGCVAALRAEGVEVTGRRCCVVGAGGAGRAVVLALARHGAREVVVVNRDAGRAALAVSLAGGIGRHGVPADVKDAEVIINATPVGMGADANLPFDASLLSQGQVVNDLVYHPMVTPLMHAAAAAGATTVGGLGMLVHQAARQFTLWTGVHAPVDVMFAAAQDELAARG